MQPIDIDIFENGLDGRKAEGKTIAFLAAK